MPRMGKLTSLAVLILSLQLTACGRSDAEPRLDDEGNPTPEQMSKDNSAEAALRLS